MKRILSLLFLMVLAGRAWATPASMTQVVACASATSCAVGAPPTAGANHTLLLTVRDTTAAGTISMNEAGWTQVGASSDCGTSHTRLTIFTKVESAGDSGGTYHVLTQNTATPHIWLSDFANVNGVDTSGTISCGTAGGNATAPSVTPNSADEEFVYAFAGSTGVALPQAAGQPFLNMLSWGNQVNPQNFEILQLIGTTNGTTATGTLAYGAGGAADTAAQTVVLKENGSGGVKVRGVTVSAGSTIGEPSNVVSTDAEFAFAETGAGAITCPSGWTSVATNTFNTSWKQILCKLTGTPSGGTAVSFGQNVDGWVLALVNANQAPDTSAATGTCATATTCTASALTPITRNDLAFAMFGSNDSGNGQQIVLSGATSTPLNWQDNGLMTSTTASARFSDFGAYTQAGTSTITFEGYQTNGGSNQNWGYVIIGIAPTVQPTTPGAGSALIWPFP